MLVPSATTFQTYGPNSCHFGVKIYIKHKANKENHKANKQAIYWVQKSVYIEQFSLLGGHSEVADKMKSFLLWRVAIVEKNRPYVAMLFIQFVYAGMALLSKAAISKEMSPYVFVVYRQAFASVALSPFAFFDRF